MDAKNHLIKYIIDEYLGGEENAPAITGFTKNQLTSWVNGAVTPQKETINHMFHCIFTLEFKIITEYQPIEFKLEKVMTQLRKIFADHMKKQGIYAFYDSMMNLVYLGKASTDLFAECNQTLNRNMPKGLFTSSVKNKPKKLFEVVKFLSAYEVCSPTARTDYPKHVESLLLRISKPILNRQIGNLEPAEANHEE